MSSPLPVLADRRPGPAGDADAPGHPDVGVRPGHPGRPRLLRAAALAVALGAPVAGLALAVHAQVPGVLTLDGGTVRAATALTRAEPALLTALLAWQEVFRPVWVNLAVALASLWAWRRHGLGARARWAVVTVLVAWGVQVGTKLLVQRARPVLDDAVEHVPGYSFPSGHAANAASAGVVLVLLLWPLLRGRGRAVAVLLVAAVVVLTALDRVFLGVHHPSDVVAGVLLGTAVAGASFVASRGGTASRPRPPHPPHGRPVP